MPLLQDLNADCTRLILQYLDRSSLCHLLVTNKSQFFGYCLDELYSDPFEIKIKTHRDPLDDFSVKQLEVLLLTSANADIGPMDAPWRISNNNKFDDSIPSSSSSSSSSSSTTTTTTKRMTLLSTPTTVNYFNHIRYMRPILSSILGCPDYQLYLDYWIQYLWFSASKIVHLRIYTTFDQIGKLFLDKVDTFSVLETIFIGQWSSLTSTKGGKKNEKELNLLLDFIHQHQRLFLKRLKTMKWSEELGLDIETVYKVQRAISGYDGFGISIEDDEERAGSRVVKVPKRFEGSQELLMDFSHGGSGFDFLLNSPEIPFGLNSLQLSSSWRQTLEQLPPFLPDFLKRCRKLSHLSMENMAPDLLHWAVLEKQEYDADPFSWSIHNTLVDYQSIELQTSLGHDSQGQGLLDIIQGFGHCLEQLDYHGPFLPSLDSIHMVEGRIRLGGPNMILSKLVSLKMVTLGELNNLDFDAFPNLKILKLYGSLPLSRAQRMEPLDFENGKLTRWKPPIQLESLSVSGVSAQTIVFESIKDLKGLQFLEYDVGKIGWPKNRLILENGGDFVKDKKLLDQEMKSWYLPKLSTVELGGIAVEQIQFRFLKIAPGLESLNFEHMNPVLGNVRIGHPLETCQKMDNGFEQGFSNLKSIRFRGYMDMEPSVLDKILGNDILYQQQHLPHQQQQQQEQEQGQGYLFPNLQRVTLSIMKPVPDETTVPSLQPAIERAVTNARPLHLIVKEHHFHSTSIEPFGLVNYNQLNHKTTGHFCLSHLDTTYGKP